MQKLMFLLLNVFLLSFGCKTDKLESIQLSQDKISMHYNESIQLDIIYSPADLDIPPLFNWYSEDTNIATVSSKGLVKGVKIGNTNITVQTADKLFRANCTVEIIPVSNLLWLPVVELGQSKAYVKSNESRVLLTEIETAIAYEGENSKIRMIMYIFEDGKLTSAYVLLQNSLEIVREIRIFLEERFDLLTISDGARIYKMNDEVIIVMMVDNAYGLTIFFMENTFSDLDGNLADNQTASVSDINRSLHKIHGVFQHP